MKLKSILVLLGVAGVGAGVALSGRKTKAATSGSSAPPPENISVVDGKLSALRMGALIAAGGSYIIVASDKKHWKTVRKVVDKRARANPQLEYVLVDMDFARELAGDKGLELPSDAWGGVAATRDAENVMYRYFTQSTGDVDTVIGEVEGAIPALGGAVTPLELPLGGVDYGVPET